MNGRPGALVDQGGLLDVAVVGRSVGVDQLVIGIELAETVAGRPDEAARLGLERPVGHQRADHLRREWARRPFRVRGHERGRGRINRRVVWSAVRRTTTAGVVDGRVVANVDFQRADRTRAGVVGLEPRVHEDAGSGWVGDVVADQAKVVRGVGAGYAADHATAVRGADRVGHVALLEIGERLAVGDDVLHGVHVAVLDRRAEHVRQHSVGDGEPHLGPGVARRSKAVLARYIHVCRGAWAAWRAAARHRCGRQLGAGRRRGGDRSSGGGDPDQHREHEQARQLDVHFPDQLGHDASLALRHWSRAYPPWALVSTSRSPRYSRGGPPSRTAVRP